MIVLSHWYLLEVFSLLQKNWILFYQCSFLHWQILYWFFFTHEASHNKWLKAYGFIIVHLLCFQKSAPVSTFTFFATCFFSLPLTRFLKPYPQSEAFLYIWAVPSVFCSNAVLTATPCSSMQLFSFFDVLPSAPTTTGMTLKVLIFHILLISLLTSW